MDQSSQRDIVKEALTNESLSQRFKSSFDLVNYAIKRANEMIVSGHGTRGQADPELNIANAVLEDIEHEPEQLPSILMETLVFENDSIEEEVEFEEEI
jgi:hypothetical protein